MNIEIERLFIGFIRSFHLLNITIDKGFRNRSLFTHEVISYWGRVGLSLGYLPWCEEPTGETDKRKRDLGWYDIENEEYVLHLETENNPGRIEHTIEKLRYSGEEYRIGIIFAKAADSLSHLEKQLKQIKTGTTLIITTWWGENRAEGPTDEDGNLEENESWYKVTGHIVESGHVKLIDREAFLVWPQYGNTLKMIFKNDTNW